MNYTWQQFDKDCRRIVMWIKKRTRRMEGHITSVYGVPRGGLILAVRISHLLRIPLILDEKEINSKTLIIDDISDSGKTLSKFKKNLIVTLFFHKQTITKPDFYCRQKKKDWISFPWERE